MNFIVEIQGCDRIQIQCAENGDILHLKTSACDKTTQLLSRYLEKFGRNLKTWTLPTEKDHSSLLIAELILRAQQKWESPYTDSEICHCRKVTTQKVEDAIRLGAHTSSDVSRLTNASTSCGSCKFDVEKLINFRLEPM